MSAPDVLVIGGGVVGTATAYYLARSGARVTLLERGDLGRGSSYGNAGLIVPSYSVPLATPETLAFGLRHLLDRHGPFAIRRRPDPALVSWLARFALAARVRKVAAAIPVLSQLAQASLALHEELAGGDEADVGYTQRGWLYVYRTEAGLREGLRQAARLRRGGVRSLVLDPSQVAELEPSLRPGLAGGVYYPEDAQVDPFRLVKHLARLAEAAGAVIRQGVEARRLVGSRGTLRAVSTADGELRAGHYVLAAGAWSTPLLAGIGARLPVEPAKGYSLTFTPTGASVTRPLMLGEEHVVVTPLGERLRMTGALELAGFDASLPAAHFDGFSQAARDYLPGLGGLAAGERWSGYRPLTPDGLPVIGPTRRFDNLVLATGHGTLGVTLGPVTGKLVSEFIVTGRTEIDPRPLLPTRFGI